MSVGLVGSSSDHSQVTMGDNGAARRLMVGLHLAQPTCHQEKSGNGKNYTCEQRKVREGEWLEGMLTYLTQI